MKRLSRKLKSEIVKRFINGAVIRTLSYNLIFEDGMYIPRVDLVIQHVLREYIRKPWPLEGKRK